MSAAPGTVMGGTDPRGHARSRDAYVAVAMIVGLSPRAGSPPTRPSQRLARGSFTDLPITERIREPALPFYVLICVMVWCFTIAFALTLAITSVLD